MSSFFSNEYRGSLLKRPLVLGKAKFEKMLDRKNKIKLA